MVLFNGEDKDEAHQTTDRNRWFHAENCPDKIKHEDDIEQGIFVDM